MSNRGRHLRNQAFRVNASCLWPGLPSIASSSSSFIIFILHQHQVFPLLSNSGRISIDQSVLASIKFPLIRPSFIDGTLGNSPRNVGDLRLSSHQRPPPSIYLLSHQISSHLLLVDPRNAGELPLSNSLASFFRQHRRQHQVPSPSDMTSSHRPSPAVAIRIRPKRDAAATLSHEAGIQLVELIEPCLAQAPKLQTRAETIDGR